MLQHAEPAAHAAEEAGHAAPEAFDAGTIILGHVANSPIDHPLIPLPTIAGINLSVTKHVLMLWIAAAVLLIVTTIAVRRYVRRGTMVPSGPVMGLFEYVAVRIRDEIVAPNVGSKWVNTYTPLILVFFLFIVTANAIGMLPVFDLLALVNHTVLHLPEDSFLVQVTHGGTTPTGNWNVTAALATISFLTIIVAGMRAHGFVGHWKNLVPHGTHPVLWILLIPIEIMGMFVRPFALTMRLAANMTGGHIAVLAVLAMIFIMAESARSAVVGLGMAAVAVPLAVGISVLEAVVVVPVQAFVFTLLTAVFVGMAIHAHH
ncbi:MAG TPA: F0F1 ATP synthase subunit A [Vicinamibacterales bacterium]|jgi:F-type H+-transporting ATPase subunit a|nr:F0F1 ATP synthase subunit A [Vicinamibacterales bacterium]